MQLEQNVLNGAKDDCQRERHQDQYPLEINNSTRHTFDLLGVGSTGIMSIYLFGGGALVQGYETMQQVVTGSIIVVATSIIGEIVAQWRPRELLGKQIDLVQEENLTLKGGEEVVTRAGQRNIQ